MSNKIMSEFETRKNLMTWATANGCHGDLLQIFQKYDNLLKNCKNEQERQQISTMGSAALYTWIGAQNGLVVDGKIIIPADKDFKEIH